MVLIAMLDRRVNSACHGQTGLPPGVSASPEPEACDNHRRGASSEVFSRPVTTQRPRRQPVHVSAQLQLFFPLPCSLLCLGER